MKGYPMEEMTANISAMISDLFTFVVCAGIVILLLEFLSVKAKKALVAKLGKKKTQLRLVREKSAPSPWETFPEKEFREYYFNRRFIMTDTEKSFFLDIIHAVPELYVFPQVSFLALLEPVGQASLGKIQSKRVDFVVCDIKTNRYCVVELDDRSHIGKQGKDLERDGFFDSAGIHSLRYKINNKPSAEALIEDIFSNLS